MRSRATAALVVTALLVAGCTSGDSGGEKTRKTPAAEDSTAVSQLFVASASEGTLEPQDAEHEFTLTLSKAHDSVSVFTDRPVRKAGTESLADFAEAWDKRGFDKTPPNAAVVWGKDSSSRIFELSDPAHDAAADTLAFTAHDLGDEPSTALSTFKGTPDDELPTELGEVSVFIDNAAGKGSIDRNNAWITVEGPPGGSATVTFDNQTVNFVGSTVAKGAAGISLTSSEAIDVLCLPGTNCYVMVHITLSPGTFPYTGNLETSSGVSVKAKYGDKMTEDFPPGAFSWDAAQ